MAESDPTPAPVAITSTKPPKAPPEILVKVSWCKGCGLCVEYCNRGVLEMKDGLPLVVEAEKCSRCLQCEVICPDFAISVVEPRTGPASEDEGAP